LLRFDGTRNYEFTNLAVNVRSDRLTWIIGPITFTDEQMQYVLGTNYSAVVAAMGLGTYMPGGDVKTALLDAIAGVVASE